jgi:hypothetical protein
MLINNAVLTGSFTVNGVNYIANTPSTGSNTYVGTQTISGSTLITGSLQVTGSIATTGTITAQTLVVQTVTSSIVYSSGSNIFGNQLTDVQQMTGSLRVTGSFTQSGTNVISSFAGSASIGTTTPLSLLDVYSTSGGTIRLSGATASSGSNYGTLIFSSNNETYRDASAAIASDGESVGVNNGNLKFYTGGRALAMTIKGSGNVGIGTSDPASRLDLGVGSGGALLTVQDGWVKHITSGFLVGSQYFYGSNEYGRILATNTGFNFTTSNSANFIFNTGNVLIGTSTNAASARLALDAIGMAVYDGGNYRQCYMNGNSMRWFNGSNEGILTSAGVWQDASDISIKKDIKDIEYGLDTVVKLKPRSYKMKEDDLEQIGFIAQEVEEFIPELVSTSEKGMKGLSYGQLTAVLTKAIQELSAKVTELENIIATK